MWNIIKIALAITVCFISSVFAFLDNQEVKPEIFIFPIDCLAAEKRDISTLTFKINFKTYPKNLWKRRRVKFFSLSYSIEPVLLTSSDYNAKAIENSSLKHSVKPVLLISLGYDNSGSPSSERKDEIVDVINNKKVGLEKRGIGTLGVIRKIASGSEVEINSSVEVKAVYHIRSKTQKSKRAYKKGFLEVKLKGEVNVVISDEISIFAEGVARSGNQDFSSGGLNSLTEKTSRYNLNFEELFVEWCEGNWFLRFGKQKFDWSVTDVVSPFDNLSPRDFTELTDWERVGILAMNFRYDGMDFFWQAVFVPRFTSSKLPRGRWQEELPPGLNFEEIIEKNNSQFALRFGKTFQNLDLTVGFYQGVSFSSYGVLNGAILESHYSKERVYSLAATSEIGGFILTRELGYYDQDKGDNFLQGALGIRREFDGVFNDNDTLSILIQYSNEIIISEDSLIVEMTDFRRGFNKSIVFRAFYEKGMNSPWRSEFEGSFSKHDYFVKPEIIYSRDDWEIESGIEIAGGSKDSFWGKYNKVKSVFFKFIFNF